MIFEKQVVNSYKGMMHTRCDDTETVYYFSADDFQGLYKEEYTFTAKAGHTLKGYFYRYDNCKEGRLIVFDHGFGGGHRAYMKEIEKLCRHGYLVFSYDHTGCMESGGDSPNGLAQSLCDLNDCITAIKADERFAAMDISVMGHSWGAFSTLNIAALYPEISHIVAMCGFVSVEEMMKTFFAGPLKGYRRAVLELERESNPDFFGFNAVKSLSDSNVKALLIYSEDDALCRRTHYDILKEGLAGKENVRFLLVKNKGHNPNYTEEAVKLLGEFSKARAKLLKKKNLSAEEKKRFVESFDWDKMTVQDEEIWNKILEHLDDEK
jgi:pimeloyl-ACP methyl ester carboxylesterase